MRLELGYDAAVRRVVGINPLLDDPNRGRGKRFSRSGTGPNEKIVSLKVNLDLQGEKSILEPTLNGTIWIAREMVNVVFAEDCCVTGGNVQNANARRCGFRDLPLIIPRRKFPTIFI
jgi:hypothetical protein